MRMERRSSASTSIPGNIRRTRKRHNTQNKPRLGPQNLRRHATPIRPIRKNHNPTLSLPRTSKHTPTPLETNNDLNRTPNTHTRTKNRRHNPRRRKNRMDRTSIPQQTTAHHRSQMANRRQKIRQNQPRRHARLRHTRPHLRRRIHNRRRNQLPPIRIHRRTHTRSTLGPRHRRNLPINSHARIHVLQKH